MRLQKLEGLRRQQIFNRQDLVNVGQQLMQPQCRTGSQTEVIFLQRRSDIIIHYARLGQLTVLCAQRCRHVLSDHHAGVDARLTDQKWRQTADQRVNQTIDAPFRNTAEFGDSDRQHIGGHRDRFAVRIGL
ncbi:hypothetical protein D3C71_1600620 [compost metagenome]